MTFTLRNLRSDDRRAFGQAEAFLLDNPDQGVRVRPEEQLRRALDTGQGLLLANDAGICGVSLVYQFDVPPAGPVYSEMGTMRVTANGYGFQALLAKVHLVQIRLEDFDEAPPPVFAVVSPGTASEHVLRTLVGLSPWTPPPDLSATRGAAGVPFTPSKTVLTAPPPSFADAAADLRGWLRADGLLASPKGGAVVRPDLGWFCPEALAAI